MVQELVHAQIGRVRTLGNPVKLSRSPARLERSAPLLGEHNDAVLKELGLADDEVEALRASGVI
jgi:crotonobetainyl-CoA:carnitine CoA-transferase CaiB-like acyl-CoA transferase